MPIWDWSYAWSTLPSLLQGLEVSLFVTALGSIGALALGLALAVLRLSHVPVAAQVAGAFVHFMRGTPFLVQLYFWFYVLPNAGVTLPPVATGIIGIALLNSAFASEVYRAGIENVPTGQWEACLALGLPLRRVWFGIILPQVTRTVLPLLANIVVAMFKETSVLSTITVFELMAQAMDQGFLTYRFLEPLTLAGLLYFLISYVASCGIRLAEKTHAHA